LFVHNAISEDNGAFTINGAATAAKGSTLEQLLRDWLASPPNAFQDLKGKLLVAKVGGEGGDGDVYGAEYGGVEGTESDVYADGEELPSSAVYTAGLEAQQSSIEFQLGSQSSTQSSADVLGSHSVGKATRQEAEAMLTGRGQIKGDFVLRQSKGASVLTCVGKGNNFLHHKLSEDGVSVLVNGKTTATAASTVSDALRDWVADPFVSNKDLKIELIDIFAEMTEDVYQEEAFEIHVARQVSNLNANNYHMAGITMPLDPDDQSHAMRQTSDDIPGRIVSSRDSYVGGGRRPSIREGRQSYV